MKHALRRYISLCQCLYLTLAVVLFSFKIYYSRRQPWCKRKWTILKAARTGSLSGAAQRKRRLPERRWIKYEKAAAVSIVNGIQHCILRNVIFLLAALWFTTKRIAAAGKKPQRNINSRRARWNWKCIISPFDIAPRNPRVFNLIRCLAIFLLLCAQCFSIRERRDGGGAELFSLALTYDAHS